MANRRMSAQDRADLQNRFQGAVVGMAIGEALGAASRDNGRSSLRAEQAPAVPLPYCGGTHLALATARSLIDCGEFRGDHLTETLAEHQAREPWRRYGEGTLKAFDLLRQGKAWDDIGHLIDDEETFGTGAAIRVAPIGLFHYGSPLRAENAARAAARLTHVHPIGEDGAALQACAIALLVSAESGQDWDSRAFLDQLGQHVRTRRFLDNLQLVGDLGNISAQAVTDAFGSEVGAHHSVPAALHAFLRFAGFAEPVLFAAKLGGDSVSVCTMTGALAGAHLGLGAIPPAWSEAIEAREDLLDLAAHLCARAVGAADVD